MLLNWIVGFLIPWIPGIFLVKRDKNAMLIAFPSAGLISLLFNDYGVYREWWILTPKDMESVLTIPFNLGIYPVVACLMLYCIRHTSIHPVVIVALSSALLTGMELILVCLDRLHYGKGWNVGLTYISYIVALALVYGYYRLHGYFFTSRSRSDNH
ncbi:MULTISPECIES: CBO0543 family protein [Paenibacillus]|uniref:CBO0543 family protein n=1 Tax=Paenibacillus TaxID=44249 RepID=UPI002FE221D9